MINNPFQQLEKLKIHIYRNRLRIGLPVKTFKVQFNPTSYVHVHETKYDCIEGVGSGSRPMGFMYIKPETLDLDLILDAVGTADYGLAGLAAGLPGPAGEVIQEFGKIGKRGVVDQVESLRKEAMKLNKSTHEPAFLKVMWGSLEFDCRMAKMAVKYTLFDRSGIPLRAELSVTLNKDTDGKRGLRINKLNSPDLTHTRVVKAGDTLPLLAKEIYGDPAFYLELARANGLNNFRELEVGATLHFPPVAT